ncbi:MAG: DotI/IcmL family type IV secretion protein [Pseudobdellovibrionaceae bacterium]
MISRRSSLLLCTLSLISLTVQSPAAQARSILDILFGEKQEEPTGPPPEKTLQAPFSDPKAEAELGKSSKYMEMYSSRDESLGDQDGLSLGSPHRSPELIAEWATETASLAMSVNPDTMDADIKTLSTDFTPYALQEYRNYLSSTGTLSSLQNNGMKMQSITEGVGAVIKEGKIGDNYHWLVQIPVMATYYDKSIKTLDAASAAQVPSQKLILRLQIGRVRPPEGEDMGIAIERWIVTKGK